MKDSMLTTRMIIENERAHADYWRKLDELNSEKIAALEKIITGAFSMSEEEIDALDTRIEEIEEEKKKLQEEFERIKDNINLSKEENALGQIMGVEMASSIWGLSPERIKHLCADGKVKSIKIGKTWIIDKNQNNPSTRKRSEESSEMGLKEINQEYEEIMHSQKSNSDKDRLLGVLMTKMEKEYKIPLMQNQEWENKNKKVIALYRKISMSRVFE